MSLEVERKFKCSNDTLKTLEKIGVCVGQQQFLDQYFDTPEFALTLRDVWLRKREKCWELKCPVGMINSAEELRAEPSLCTRYKEITNLPEIYQKVIEVLGDACGDEGSNPSLNDDSWLEKLNLICFAKFTTVRKSFTLEGVHIDLDQADFGYQVGEIEVLIDEERDINSAQEKIKTAAEQLGIIGNNRVEGKMHVYLKRYHQEHYAKLLAAHIL